ncbi:MAG: response regulator [Thermodesulfobacteriota bacterium]
MKILVVEENEMLRSFLARVFDYWDIEADLLRNYKEAIAHFNNSSNKKSYTSVLLEITDGIDSREILKVLKETNPDIKAIACCNNPFEKTVYDFDQHGFENVLIKPFQLDDLKIALDIF